MYKTTKKEFELFKKECRKWIKFFGLFDWEVYYEHVELKEKAYATCHTDMLGMVATFSFNKVVGTNIRDDIRRTAFHEVCELLISKLKIIAKCRFLSEDEITTANHEIIRRLENCVFDKLK